MFCFEPSADKHFNEKEKPEADPENKRMSLVDGTFAGTQVVFGIVQGAAAFTPGGGSYVASAATAASGVIAAIQKVKDNKADLKQVAEEASSLIGIIYNDYEDSTDKESWPEEQLKQPLEKFIKTLGEVQRLAHDRANKNMFARFFGSMFDSKKIQEYRDNMRNARSHFDTAAQLQVNQLLLKLAKRVGGAGGHAYHNQEETQ